MPAQLTATLTSEPKRDLAKSSARITSSADVTYKKWKRSGYTVDWVVKIVFCQGIFLRTSAGEKATLSPSPAATAAPSLAGRSTIMTLAPCLASRSTVALPSPDAPPVTKAIFRARVAIYLIAKAALYVQYLVMILYCAYLP
jgi:hypothetical protein